MSRENSNLPEEEEPKKIKTDKLDKHKLPERERSPVERRKG